MYSYVVLIYDLNNVLYSFRFDLELEIWGIDINALKEPASAHTFVRWTEDWEKEKWLNDDAVNKVLFHKKVQGFTFCFD